MGKNQKISGEMPKSRPSMEHDSFTVEGRDCFAADGNEVNDEFQAFSFIQF
jgi:hypothetical protein